MKGFRSASCAGSEGAADGASPRGPDIPVEVEKRIKECPDAQRWPVLSRAGRRFVRRRSCWLVMDQRLSPVLSVNR